TAGSIEALRAREATARDEWQDEATEREGIAAGLNLTEASLTEKKLSLLELERELLTAQGGRKDREEARVAGGHQSVLLRGRAAGVRVRDEEAGHEAAGMRQRLEETRAKEHETRLELQSTRGRREASHAESEQAEAALAQLEQELRAGRSLAAEQKQLSLDLF